MWCLRVVPESASKIEFSKLENNMQNGGTQNCDAVKHLIHLLMQAGKIASFYFI